ncbi:MAG: hypothetical protein JW839_12940 [Candidatus Lokiarchaeota archaeon]|nr:hypothetical protein [Candidatus Lokiarchaeota archaeon]
MPEFKIIKTVPNLSADVFERAIKCDKFWMACITGLERAIVKATGEGKMHWDLRAYFLLDPLGVTKIPVDVQQDMLYNEDASFKGEGKKYVYSVANSNAASAAEGNLFFKASGRDIKIMVEVTRLELKAGFLDIAGIGKAMVMTRLQQEMQQMVTNLIDLAMKGKVDEIVRG